MGFFAAYLRRRRRVIGSFALVFAVFAAAFALYRVPLGAVAYPALLSGVLWLLLALWDAWRQHCRHEEMARLPRQLADLPPERLPPAETLGEEDYRALVRRLQREHRALRQETDRRYHDTVDYFTLWAHQVKTPIAAMRLTLQNEDTGLSRRLTGEVLRVEQYVDMAMAFLRLGSESTDYVIRTCDLDAIVRGAVKKFSGEFIDRRLRLDFQPLDARVLTDEKWLAFVVEQVLSNALKYTPGGGITICQEPGPVLCIRDTGIGIAPEDLPRIFERGYTGATGRRDRQSSGIGLYLCRRICDNLGHTIAVQSQVGEGTCVRIGLARPDVRFE
jgi:signal transduction histidine kinase